MPAGVDLIRPVAVRQLIVENMRELVNGRGKVKRLGMRVLRPQGQFGCEVRCHYSTRSTPSPRSVTVRGATTVMIPSSPSVTPGTAAVLFTTVG